MNNGGNGAEAGLGEREESGRSRRPAHDAKYGAEEIMQIAQRVALRRLLCVSAGGRIGGVPVLMRERSLLRKQYGDYEDDAP